jgi:HSP20 family protein
MFQLLPWAAARRYRNGSRHSARQGDVFSQFDEVFNHLFRAPATQSTGRETENEFIFSFDAPGFEAGEFDIQITDDEVTVTAEHVLTEGEQKWTERSFRRLFALPEKADAAKVQAKYRNGVLELRFGKVEEAKPRKIEVKVE